GTLAQSSVVPTGARSLSRPRRALGLRLESRGEPGGLDSSPSWSTGGSCRSEGMGLLDPMPEPTAASGQCEARHPECRRVLQCQDTSVAPSPWHPPIYAPLRGHTGALPQPSVSG